MAPPTVPVGVPDKLVAGDTATWDVGPFADSRYGQFTSTTWTLTTRLIGTVGSVDVTGAAEGTGWRSSVTAAETNSLRPAAGTEPVRVQWVQQVTSGSDVYTVGSGTLQVYPNPAFQQSGAESHPRVLLAAVRTAITNLVTGSIKQASIGSRSYTKNDLTELRSLEKELAATVWAEEHPGQLGPAVLVRFT